MLMRFFGRPETVATANTPLPPALAITPADLAPSPPPPAKTDCSELIGILRAAMAGELRHENGWPGGHPTEAEIGEFLAVFAGHATEAEIYARYTALVAQLHLELNKRFNAVENGFRGLLRLAAQHRSQVSLTSTPLNSIDSFTLGGREVVSIAIARLPAGHPLRSPALPATCLHSSPEMTGGGVVACLFAERSRFPAFASITAFETGAAALAAEARRVVEARKQSIEEHNRRAREHVEANKTPMAIMRERLAKLEGQLAANNGAGGTP